jgi:hypothetical protein
VATSWSKSVWEYKSSWTVTASFLLKSRETKAAKIRQLREEINELKKHESQLMRRVEEKDEKITQLTVRVQQLEVQRAAPQTVTLPDDPPVGTHGYGSRMISLAVNLARKIGLRGAAYAIEKFFEWLGIEQKTPCWTAIRSWLQRLGIAMIQEPIERADDWVWMADHSNQVGVEKALVMLGTRASLLPEAGTALNHADVRVLTVEPGTQWKKEDMSNVYDKLAEQWGAPRAVLVDGAVELREGANCLKTRRSDTIVLRDFKHYAANVFKSLIGNDPQFKEFGKGIGITRSAIQQTEVAHLTPPKPKPKSRFMNLSAILHWATTVLWLLDHPEAKSRAGITDERMEDKLGWLREFREDLSVWQECQNVLSPALKFINQHGLYQGSSVAIRAAIGEGLVHDKSRQFVERLVEFVDQGEQQLNEGERLPMSTEILESSFSLYKQLERQHSKGGFTSLLATFAALLKPTTPKEITKAFAQVSNKDVKAWVKKHLSTTLTSKRTAAYREYDAAIKCATIQTVTT